jgi:ABC-type antimicrobial peptide transport system permease subunit
MKSKKAMLIMAMAAIFIAAYAVFLVLYYQRTAEQNLTKNQITTLGNVVTKPIADKRPLEDELARIQSELSVARDAFSVSLESLDITDVLIAKAQTSNVEIKEINITAAANRQINGIAYLMVPVSLVISGEKAGILDFIGSLEEEPQALKTAQLNSVTVTENDTSLTLYIYANQDQNNV